MEFQIGDKVSFTDNSNHIFWPEHYPEIGTIGTVIYISPSGEILRVQWPQGTTSEDDSWLCKSCYLELFEPATNDLQQSDLPLEFLYMNS